MGAASLSTPGGSPPACDVPANPVVEGPSQGPRILRRPRGCAVHAMVVDDSAVAVTHGITLLKNLGKRAGGEWTVEGAGSGAACLDLLAAAPRRRRVVFLDMVMPGLSGLETLERIVAGPHGPDTDVCVVTGADDAASEALCRSAGASHVLLKPLTKRKAALVLGVADLCAAAPRRAAPTYVPRAHRDRSFHGRPTSPSAADAADAAFAAFAARGSVALPGGRANAAARAAIARAYGSAGPAAAIDTGAAAAVLDARLADAAGTTVPLRALLPAHAGNRTVLCFYGTAADARARNALRLLAFYARALGDGTDIAGVCTDSSRSIDESTVRLGLPFPSFSDLGLGVSAFYAGFQPTDARDRSAWRLGLVSLGAGGRVLAREVLAAAADGGAADRVLDAIAASTERLGGRAMAALSLINCRRAGGTGEVVSDFLEANGVDVGAVERAAFADLGIAPLRPPHGCLGPYRERRIVCVLSADPVGAKALVAKLLLLGHTTTYAAAPRDADAHVDAGRAHLVLVDDGTRYERADVAVTHLTSRDMLDLENAVADRGPAPPGSSPEP